MLLLWAGPREADDLKEEYSRAIDQLGVPLFCRRRATSPEACAQRSFAEAMEIVLREGWVTESAGCVALTPAGRAHLGGWLGNLFGVRDRIVRLQEPRVVSKVTSVAHFGLAAIKLPAALLSGSLGLLNDSLDSLADGIANILVYIGIRLNRERLAGALLAILMLLIGGVTAFESVLRLVRPQPHHASWFALAAASLSMLVCLVLFVWQRFVGMSQRAMALVVQSVDSRNHVVIGAGVFAGLLASELHLGLLDTLVGVAVSILIIKSAVEVTIDAVRSLRGGEAVVDGYESRVVNAVDGLNRRRSVTDWAKNALEIRTSAGDDDLAAAWANLQRAADGSETAPSAISDFAPSATNERKRP